MRRRHRLQVDTFPFLAVLLCAMGALILILLVMDRRSRLAAVARARESALLARRRVEDSAEQDDALLDAERKASDARLEAERKALDDEMRQVQARLAEVARELRTEEAGVGNLRRKVRGKQIDLKGHEQTYQAARKEAETLKTTLTAEERARQSLAAELVQLEEVIRDLKSTRQRDALTYSVIPYKGKYGEQRRPLYVECTRLGHLFHPDRFELIDPSVETLRLEIVRRVTRVAENRRRAGLKDERPYLMMLIRPEGIMRYYQVQSAIRELPVEFGYEFVDADWVLSVPPEATELAGTAEPSLSKPTPDEPIRNTGSGTSTGSVGEMIAGRLSSGGDGGRDGTAGGGVSGGNGFGPPGNGPGGGGGPAGLAGRPPSNLGLLGLGGTGGNGSFGSGGSLFGGLGGSGGGTTRGGSGGVFGNAPGGPGGLPGRSPGNLMAGGPGGSSGNTPGGGGGQGGVAGRSTGDPTGSGLGGPLGDLFGGTGGGGSPTGMAGRPPSNLALLGLGGTGGNGGYGRPGGSGGSLLGGPGGSGGGTPGEPGVSAGNRGGSGQATAGLGGRSTGPPSSGGDPNRSAPALFGMRTGSDGGTSGASSSPIPLPDDGSGRPGKANPDGPTKPIFENSIPPAAGDAVAKASSAIQVPSILPTVAAAPAGGTGGNTSAGSGNASAGSGNASPGGSGSGGSSNEPVAQGERRPSRPGFHGPDSLAPPPRRNRPLLPARIGDAEETTVFIECRSTGVVIHPIGQSIPLAALAEAPANNALHRTVVAQLAMHKGNPARRQVRFLIHRDAERTFHAAYPILDDVKVDKTRYTLQPGDDVSRLILVD